MKNVKLFTIYMSNLLICLVAFDTTFKAIPVSTATAEDSEKFSSDVFLVGIDMRLTIENTRFNLLSAGHGIHIVFTYIALLLFSVKSLY